MEIFMSLFFNFFSGSFSNDKTVQWTWSSMGQYMLLFHQLSCKICGMGIAEVDTTKHRMCFPLVQSPITAGSSFASPDTDCIKDRKTLSACAQPSTGEAKGKQHCLGPWSVPSPEMVLHEHCAQALLSRESNSTKA